MTRTTYDVGGGGGRDEQRRSLGKGGGLSKKGNFDRMHFFNDPKAHYTVNIYLIILILRHVINVNKTFLW